MSRRIAVLGAGPIGLEAALAATQAGHRVVVYERGEVAQNVADWGFVRFFSPWRMNVTELGRKVTGLQADDEACPTGREFRDHYLLPLARSLDVRTGTRVLALGRQGIARHEAIGDTARRAASPFRLLVSNGKAERAEQADVILDCTGTYAEATGRPAGLGGMPAPGESAARAAGRIRYTLPDVLGRDRGAYADRHLLVVGCGYSAATLLRHLESLSTTAPRTRATWVFRTPGPALLPIESDPLPDRSELVELVRCFESHPPAWLQLAPASGVELIRLTNARDPTRGRLLVDLAAVEGGRSQTIEVDRIVAMTGYGPDDGLWRHLQVHQCFATAGPMKTSAALLRDAGRGAGDCLEVGSCVDAAALRNPEPDFYVMGAKSYGTNSNFLLSAGHAQLAQVLKELL